MDPDILRFNERMKATSGLLFNLGGGVAAAVTARIYEKLDVDIYAIGWTFGGFALIFVAWKLVGMLELDL